LAFFGDNASEDFFTLDSLTPLRRHENHPNTVITRRRQADTRFFGDELEKIVWWLDYNSRAIARIGFAPASAAMIEVQQKLQGLADDGVRFFSLYVDYKPDPAGIVFELWIVQTLLAWRLASRRRIALPA